MDMDLNQKEDRSNAYEFEWKRRSIKLIWIWIKRSIDQMDLNSNGKEDTSNESKFESKGGSIKWIKIWVKKRIDQMYQN
jgi:hypothetical protein